MTGHRPRKRFGQHFLHDPAVLARIVAAIDPRPGERIVEIGPGQGALMRCATPISCSRRRSLTAWWRPREARFMDG